MKTAYVVTLDEEFQKGRGPDKGPRKKRIVQRQIEEYKHDRSSILNKLEDKNVTGYRRRKLEESLNGIEETIKRLKLERG